METIIKKVEKLLALAGNNPSQEEAYSALLKARELMADHGLVESDILATGEKKEILEIVCHEQFREKYLSRLASEISQAHGVYAYVQTSTKNGVDYRRAVFYGVHEKAAMAAQVMDYAVKIVRYRMNNLPYRGYGIRGIKESYVIGFCRGQAISMLHRKSKVIVWHWLL